MRQFRIFGDDIFEQLGSPGSAVYYRGASDVASAQARGAVHAQAEWRPVAPGT